MPWLCWPARIARRWRNGSGGFATALYSVADADRRPHGPGQSQAGRYAKLLPAILLYLSYFLLLSAGKSALERGQLPVWPGLYLVPLFYLLFFALPLSLSETLP